MFKSHHMILYDNKDRVLNAESDDKGVARLRKGRESDNEACEACFSSSTTVLTVRYVPLLQCTANTSHVWVGVWVLVVVPNPYL